MAERKSTTLFVRNLPYSTTNERLLSLFEDVGPIRTAFAVSDKATGKCRGFGYVKYSVLEDAAKAMQSITHCDGRKIFLAYANAKKTRKGKPTDDSVQAEGDKTDNKPEVQSKDKKKAKQSEKCNVQPETSAQEQDVSKPPHKKSKLRSKNAKIKPEKSEPEKTVPKAEKSTGLKPVLADPKSTPKPPKKKALKRCRLIVRNLSFKCTEAQLKKQFEKFGDISEVTIPLKSGKLSRGFGFVQFTNLGAAQRAVANLNAKEILGRTVAVDWAVAKDRFESSAAAVTNDVDQEKDSEEQKDGSGSSDSEENEADKSKDMSSDEDMDDSGSGEEEKEEEETDDDDDDSVDVDDDTEEGSSSEEMEDDASGTGDDESDGNSSEGEDEEEDDSDEEEENDKAAKKSEKPAITRKSDVEEGRTLFVRNIPFTAEEEEVAEVFEEFGELSYVRLVVDKATGQSRGTAFVQFKSKDGADNCLARVQQGREKELKIQGRTLLVTLAVSKMEAANKKGSEKKAEQKDTKDNRNLFLAREGLIREGTQAAVGISPEDMRKRMNVEQMKRTKLKDINIFVSSTRLCVHNLPVLVHEAELKKALKKTVDEPNMKITECRIMRDMDRKNKEGRAKSLGYAFVNFSTHEQALKALRGLNNSTVFGDKRRPIVEFSLENRRALETKQRRLEKSKAANLKRKLAKEEAPKDGGAAQAKRPKLDKNKPRPHNTEQDSVARSMHKGPKGMPKRMGPKIRQRNKGKREEMQRKEKKLRKKKQPQQQHKTQQPAKAKSKRKKKGEVTDHVDKLIQKRMAQRV